MIDKYYREICIAILLVALIIVGIKKDTTVLGAIQHDRYNAAGKYNATAPTLSSGEQELLQLDSSGNLKVNIQ